MTTRVIQILFLCVITLLSASFSGEVFAQSATSTATTTEQEVVAETKTPSWYTSERITGNIQVGDFVVGPGRAEVFIKPGETVVQEITVTNRISSDRTFKLEVEDITGSKDGSSAVSLMGDDRGPYSIRDYISFPEDEFTLDLGERARIPVIITVPADAEPGGYYGSVLVSTVQNSQSEAGAGAPRSPVIARVGSLVFLRVAGEVTEEGQLIDFSTINQKKVYESGPVEFAILSENTGSVHLNPYGEISVRNMFGEEVGFVELEPWFVLPSSLRSREVTWDREFLLGRYNATARINRGYNDVVDEISYSFWVLPWRIVGGLFVILFVIIFSVRAFFRTFEFKRRDV